MNTKYYSRKCDVCNKGMEEGFVIHGNYACSKNCIDNLQNYSYSEYLKDYEEDSDSAYYTDWEQDWNMEQTLYLEDGTEVENPYYEDIYVHS